MKIHLPNIREWLRSRRVNWHAVLIWATVIAFWLCVATIFYSSNA